MQTMPNTENEAGEGRAHESAESPEMESSEDQGESNVSPEEQAMYDNFVGAALHQIWQDDMSHQAIMRKMKDEGPGNIGKAIGHTAAMLCRSIEGGLKRAGREIPEDVLFAGAQEVVENLIEMADAAGMIPEEKKETIFEEAVLEGTKAYADAKQADGEVTPEQSAKAATELQELSAQAKSMAPKEGPSKDTGGIVAAAKGA